MYICTTIHESVVLKNYSDSLVNNINVILDPIIAMFYLPK